uniref:Uncharacterized protein n=1 Tax=Arundo donax TaxID=35708 RepID=A0A0A9FX08_ARUDO
MWSSIFIDEIETYYECKVQVMAHYSRVEGKFWYRKSTLNLQFFPFSKASGLDLLRKYHMTFRFTLHVPQ